MGPPLAQSGEFLEGREVLKIRRASTHNIQLTTIQECTRHLPLTFPDMTHKDISTLITVSLTHISCPKRKALWKANFPTASPDLRSNTVISDTDTSNWSHFAI